MYKIHFQKTLITFGLEVTTFPAGISEAFDELIKATGDCAGERNYYGLSYMKDGKIIYNAVAEEKQNGEASTYNYKVFTIEAGDFYAEKVNDWQSKTHCIKNVFMEMMKHENVDQQKPAVEWYKNDKEMWCMLKAK